MTAVVAVMAPVSITWASGCPNEQLREEQVYGLRLPDCRAYEQVSPVRKNLTDAAGEPGIVQASPSGDGVSFFAVAPFPGTAGSAGQLPTYLGIRSPDDEWLTEGLLPVAAPGSSDQVIGVTEDLAKTIVLAEEPAARARVRISGARNAYVENNATGSYQLLAPNIGFEKLSFAGGTPGGIRILFETKAQLPTANVTPAPGVTNLYEWNEAKPLGERISLAGVLPNGTAPVAARLPVQAAPAIAPPQPGGSTSEFYTQDTISEDGARIFFTDVRNRHRLHARTRSRSDCAGLGRESSRRTGGRQPRADHLFSTRKAKTSTGMTSKRNKRSAHERRCRRAGDARGFK